MNTKRKTGLRCYQVCPRMSAALWEVSSGTRAGPDRVQHRYVLRISERAAADLPQVLKHSVFTS